MGGAYRAKNEMSTIIVFAVFDSVCLNGRSYLAKRERSTMIVFAVFDSVCLNGRSYLSKNERSVVPFCLSGRGYVGKRERPIVFAVFDRRIPHLKPHMPTPDDFYGACSAIVRLHRVYKLRVDDMYAGNYSGYLGPPLKPDDAFEVS